MHRNLIALGQFAILLVAAGCADKVKSNRPKVVSVNGRVLFNGEPLVEANVTLNGAAANRAAYGVTDRDGRFTLTTFEQGDGAVLGTHRVSVRKVQELRGADPGVDYSKLPAGKAPPIPEVRWLIPPRYGSFKTSDLTVEIADKSKNEILLELTGKPQAESTKGTTDPAAAKARTGR